MERIITMFALLIIASGVLDYVLNTDPGTTWTVAQHVVDRLALWRDSGIG